VLSELSVVRYRASLSSFFGWYVRERIIRANPVSADRTRARCPSHLQQEGFPASPSQLAARSSDKLDLR
jgi:hypothetical protein